MKRQAKTKDQHFNYLEESSRSLREHIDNDYEQRQHSTLFENSPNIIVEVDKNGTIIFINPAGLNISGYSLEEVLGQPVLKCVIQDDRKKMQYQIQQVLKGQGVNFQAAIIIKNKEVLQLQVTYIPNVLEENVIGFYAIAQDITEAKKKDELLLQSQRLLTDIFHGIQDGISVVDCDLNILRINQAMSNWYSLNESPKGAKCYQTYHRRNSPCEDCLVIKTIHTKETQRAIGNRVKGKWFEAYAFPMIGDQGDVLGVIEHVRDITEQKKLQDKLEYLSLHDTLTGLYNRVYFERRMDELVDECNVGLVLCDIDGLKIVNDTFDLEVGNKLLITVGHLIKKCVPEGDACRIGGDEFAVIITDATSGKLEEISSCISQKVGEFNHDNPQVPLSISVGYSKSDKAPLSKSQLFKEADDNMYRQKLHHINSNRSEIVQTLMKMLEMRDYITEGHADRLQDIVELMAKHLNLPEYSRSDLRLLAQFHDIGKVGISDNILFKPGPLTEKEYKEMQRHSEIGQRIASASSELSSIAEWILKHHEWWNGQGYPLGLKEEEIPLECRILAIADAYDAMTSDRPYRQAMSHQEAIKEIKRCAGQQFDPQLVDGFIEVLSNKYVTETRLLNHEKQ